MYRMTLISKGFCDKCSGNLIYIDTPNYGARIYWKCLDCGEECDAEAIDGFVFELAGECLLFVGGEEQL